MGCPDCIFTRLAPRHSGRTLGDCEHPVKRALQIIIMGFLASLFGCGRQPASPPTAAPAKDVFMIDYAHESDCVSHHGTFSLIGGKVGATWTLDRGGKKESRDIPLSEDAFRSIWDGVTDIPDFKTGAVKDPSQQLDPSTYHIVGIVFRVGGQKGMRTCMIASASASPEFKQWLTKIGYTGK